MQGLKAAGLAGVRVTARIPYEARKLTGLFGDPVCGIGPDSPEVGALARAAAGKIWSARFEAVKPQPARLASEITVAPAEPADLVGVERLLQETDLPADVQVHLADFLVARHRERLVGCIGMETYGPEALFRSLAVSPAYQGLGLAHRLQHALEERAQAHGVSQVYLLTKTIEPLAVRWGYRRIERNEVPEAIRSTSEFRGDCCASAVAMAKELLTAGTKIGCT